MPAGDGLIVSSQDRGNEVGRLVNADVRAAMLEFAAAEAGLVAGRAAVRALPRSVWGTVGTDFAEPDRAETTLRQHRPPREALNAIGWA